MTSLDLSAAPPVGYPSPCPRGGAAPVDQNEVISQLGRWVAELVVVVDGAGYVLWTNDRMDEVLGWDPGQWIGHHAAEIAHPDDIPLGMELLVSAQATGPGVKEPVTYRLARSDGSYVQVECISSVVELASGQHVLVVSGRPTGAARPTSAIFEEASARVSAMFDEALIGMAQVALDGRILRINRHLVKMVGADGHRVLGTPFERLVHPDDRTILCGAEGLLTGEGGRAPCVRFPTGATTSYGQAASSLIYAHTGEPLYYALQVVDITELKAVEEDLRRLTLVDRLTGLGNRAMLDAVVSIDGDVASVLYVDLDGFKAVNDALGHAVGDEVLVAVAERLRGIARRDDVIVRLGGDEFVLVCPRTFPADARAMSARLVDVVSLPIPTSAGTVQVTASVGVAAATDGLVDGDVLRRADLALYESKRAGGARTSGAGVSVA